VDLLRLDFFYQELVNPKFHRLSPTSIYIYHHHQVRNMSGISHAGYLSKKGHLVSNWKHRYFVIQGDQVSYYKTQDISQAAKGSFSLSKANIVKLKDDAKSKWLGFIVTVDGGKQFSLRSLDSKDREAWIDAMEKAGGRFSQSETRLSNLDLNADDEVEDDLAPLNSSSSTTTTETSSKSPNAVPVTTNRSVPGSGSSSSKTKPPPPPVPLNNKSSLQEEAVACSMFGGLKGNRKKNESSMDAAYRERREEFQRSQQAQADTKSKRFERDIS
jgi:hypothetical protein